VAAIRPALLALSLHTNQLASESLIHAALFIVDLSISASATFISFKSRMAFNSRPLNIVSKVHDADFPLSVQLPERLLELIGDGQRNRDLFGHLCLALCGQIEGGSASASRVCEVLGLSV
jgi:hypothetical protein